MHVYTDIRMQTVSAETTDSVTYEIIEQWLELLLSFCTESENVTILNTSNYCISSIRRRPQIVPTL